MNRRQLMQAVAATCSASGVANLGDFAVYGGEEEPTLAVIHSPGPLSPDQVDSIRACWDSLRKKSPKLPPCVVLGDGLRLEMLKTVNPEKR